LGQVTSFGSRSVNGGNGAEAMDEDFVVRVRFPVCGEQKQTVGFRPSASKGRTQRALSFPWPMMAGKGEGYGTLRV